MRYLGMSLGMAVALGYCTVFGILIPPLCKGEFHAKLIEPVGGRWVLAGLVVCVVGIVINALAGKIKEVEMSGRDPNGRLQVQFVNPAHGFDHPLQLHLGSVPR